MQHKRTFADSLSGTDIVNLLDSAVANAELRMNFPQIREPWQLYTYTLAPTQRAGAFRLPQNWVGQLWDVCLKDGKGLLASLGLERLIVGAFDNYEIFLEKDDFVAFADEYAAKAESWPFVKVLIRKCVSETYFGHRRPLYAIDLAIRALERDRALSRAVFAKYPSARLHPAKFIGGLFPTIPKLACETQGHAR